MRTLKLTNGTIVTPIKLDPRRPLAKFGRRLGSWTNKFYKPMWLCRVHHRNGTVGLEWIKASRIKEGVEVVGSNQSIGVERSYCLSCRKEMITESGQICDECGRCDEG
jgi:hypothetical protein